jgi:CRP/FNR family cyclic AMP-dependent transcriptional regulator
MEAMLRSSLWAPTLNRQEMDEVSREVFERRVPAGGYAIRCGEPAEMWIGIIEGLLSAVSRQRANQALKALERDGLLRIEFGGVSVLDPPGLRRYSGSGSARSCRQEACTAATRSTPGAWAVPPTPA